MRPARRDPSAFSVGLVWEAGNWDRRRCVPWELLGRLASETGARLLSLQQGPARQAGAAIPAKDIAAPDIESLASSILTLDVIVTVAHLAGALGAPVWTTLHADCDWRWPTSGRRLSGIRQCVCFISNARATGPRSSPTSSKRCAELNAAPPRSSRRASRPDVGIRQCTIAGAMISYRKGHLLPRTPSILAKVVFACTRNAHQVDPRSDRSSVFTH
jgi:hypothetical protein